MNDKEINLKDQTPGELATLLESLPLESRLTTWDLIENSRRSEVMRFLHEQVKSSLINRMSPEEIISVAENMRPSGLASLIEKLPESSAGELFQSLTEEDQTKVEFTLKFEDDQVGRLLNYDVLRFRKADIVAKVLEQLKTMKLPHQTDQIFITTRDNTYIGAVNVNDLFSSKSTTRLEQLLDESSVRTINVNQEIHDLLQMYRNDPFLMKAVVNEDNQLVGRITLNKVMKSIREESEHQLMGAAGLNEEEDLFAPVVPSAKRRAVWLGINLMTAFLASWVIGFYQETLEQVVALAVLMPIVASMGGITGSQSLTLVIRGLALNLVNGKNLLILFKKEIGVAVLNAILWALTVALITFFWFEDAMLSLIIAVALVVNTVVAAGVGVYLPVILKKMKIDPALSGAVILTTVTDVVGFLTFLGLGTLLLLN